MPQIDLQNDDTLPGVPDVIDLERWVTAALLKDLPDLEQTIRIVDRPESQSLNAQFRGIDKPTNVLSFPLDDAGHLPYSNLGDLVICQPVVADEAEQQGKTEQAHWAHMVVHGMLHLQGFDHLDDTEADEMEAREVEILSTLGFANPYNDAV